MNPGFWGRTKPPPGTPIDWGHPLAKGLRIALPLWEGAGGATFDAVHGVKGSLKTGLPWGGTGDASGNSGTGLKTNGAYVAFGADTRFNFSGDQTIFARFYYDGTGSGNRRILTSPQTDSGSIENYALYITSSAILTLSVAASSGVTRTVPDTTGLATGWHSAAGRIPAAQAGGIQLFRDSQQFTNSLTAVRFQGSAPVFYLSRFNGSNEQNWPGYIECVWIWERLLSDAEIALLTSSPYCFFAAPVWRRGRKAATAYSSSLAGTVTSAGALVKAAAKPLAGSAASAGALVRACGKVASGSISSAGALVKASAKVLAGSLSPAGQLVKASAKALAGGCASAGGLVRASGKIAAGSLTSSGGVVKACAKVLAGSASSAGGAVKAGAKALAGSCASAGVLGLGRAKALAGAIASTSGLVRTSAKEIAGAISPAGTLSKACSKLFAGTLALSASLAHFLATKIHLRLSGAISDPKLSGATGSDALTGERTDSPLDGTPS